VVYDNCCRPRDTRSASEVLTELVEGQDRQEEELRQYYIN
jgi:hypothetical protein